MNPGVYGPLDSAINLYTGLPINKQRVSKPTPFGVRSGSVTNFEVCSGSVRGLFGIRSGFVRGRPGFVQGPFGVCSGFGQGPFGIRSESVLGLFGVRSRALRGAFGIRILLSSA